MEAVPTLANVTEAGGSGAVARVLVVDDDEADVRLVHESLVDRYDVAVVDTLADAIEACRADACDVVLLDLSLPDGWGLDTLLSFRRSGVSQPVIVVTGSQSDDFRAKAVRAGAAGFVHKGEVIGDELVELIERARVDPPPAASPRSVFEQPRSSASTAAAFGQSDLRDAAPELFDQLVLRYLDLVELAIEQASFAADYRSRVHLEDFAKQLGGLGAGPRDVTAIHARAMRHRLEDPDVVPSRAADEETRLVVIELMGYLVLYYRLRAMGRPEPGRPDPGAP